MYRCVAVRTHTFLMINSSSGTILPPLLKIQIVYKWPVSWSDLYREGGLEISTLVRAFHVFKMW